MNQFNHLIINKNRGWRGLAEVIVRNKEYKDQLKMVFSFSQPMWRDLIDQNIIVAQDQENYYVLYFRPTTGSALPRPEQQRSVLIKNFVGEITQVDKYAKAEWTSAKAMDWRVIRHFIQNKNNHTTSDWNCIGVRVVPTI